MFDLKYTRKPKAFYKHGNMQLPEIWRKVINQNVPIYTRKVPAFGTFSGYYSGKFLHKGP
jgi:hypothetical protein